VKSELGETPSPKIGDNSMFSVGLVQARANSSDSYMSNQSLQEGSSGSFPMLKKQSSSSLSYFGIGGNLEIRNDITPAEISEEIKRNLTIDPNLSIGSASSNSSSSLHPPPTPINSTGGINSPDVRSFHSLALKTPLPDSPLPGGNFTIASVSSSANQEIKSLPLSGFLGSDEDEDESIGLELFGTGVGDGMLEVVTAPNSTYFDGFGGVGESREDDMMGIDMRLGNE
jgi:hypothetical protein